MGRSYRNYNNTNYPEEKEGNAKDANKKLKAQIKSLKKIIKNLESENKTLLRSFNKSCDFINQKLSDKNIHEIIKMIDDFDYKETENGRQREEQKKKEKIIEKEEKKEKQKECPKCFLSQENGFKIIDFTTFKVYTCSCGYRTRVDVGDEGIKRS